MDYNISDYIIRAHISDGETFINGRDDFQSEKVSEMKIADFSGRIIVCDVCGGYGKKYSVKLFFDKKGSVLNSLCTCGKSRCRHIAAAMFKMMNSDNLKKSGIIFNKNNAARELSECLKKIDFPHYNRKIKKKTNIYPLFILNDDNRCIVSFFIGNKNFYKIENIYEFYEKLMRGDNFYLDKDVYFNPTEFKSDIFKYAGFIKKQIDDFLDFADNVKDIFSKDYITLGKRGVDDFFRLLKGQTVRCDLTGKGGAFKEVVFCDEEFDFRVKLEKSEDCVKLRGNFLNTVFIEGSEFGYAVKDNFIYKISSEKFGVIKAINNMCILFDNDDIEFSESDMPDFANNIMPVLKEKDILENPDDIYNIFSVTKPDVEFYIETDGKNIFLEIKYIYYGEFDFKDVFQAEIEKIVFDIGFEYEFGNVYSMRDETNIFNLYDKNIDSLKKIGTVFLSDDFEKRKIKIYKNIIKEVKVSNGILEIDFDFENINLDEVRKILDAYRIKKKFFRMKDGSFIDIEKSSLQTGLEVIDGFDLSEKDFDKKSVFLPIYNVLYLNEIIAKSECKINADNVYNKIIQSFKNIENNNYEIPKSIKNVLRDYQKKGFLWLKALSSLNFGGILADDMGLGKTIQIISLILSEKEKKPSIIICPTSLIYNWKAEIEKFAPDIVSEIIAGNQDKRREKILYNDFTGVFITTYDTIKRDIKLYKNIYFKFIIADEAQNIKNSFTQNAKTVKMLNGDTRFALTGTPIENALTELWSVFDFVMPGYLGTNKKFKSAFEKPIIKYGDEQAYEKLKRKIKPFILRRIKKDVLKELPEKSETVLYCEMTDLQRKLYNANLIKARNNISQLIENGEFETNKIKILSYITRLRQICCHPSLFVKDYYDGSGKLELAVDTIKNVLCMGHRILLFSQFTSMLNIIKDELEKENISFFYLDGATSSENRVYMSERFNNGEKKIFLISLKAGGTGLNLTGADIVIHFDPWWNPAVMEQASDRAYRFGQMKNVQVFYLVAKNSIEEKIIMLQNKKKELIKSVISDDGEINAVKLTKEDIIDIFKD